MVHCPRRICTAVVRMEYIRIFGGYFNSPRPVQGALKGFDPFDVFTPHRSVDKLMLYWRGPVKIKIFFSPRCHIIIVPTRVMDTADARWHRLERVFLLVNKPTRYNIIGTYLYLLIINGMCYVQIRIQLVFKSSQKII